MLMKASMVPLPVTADEKFLEAVYFFNRMVEVQTNVRLFPFHLSAFLSALRSVTFFLQAQFSGDAEFEAWYQEKQNSLRTDPIMRMLKELRDESLHAQPLSLCFWHGPPIPDEGISTKHFELSVTTDSQGEIKMGMKVSAEAEEVQVKPRVSWVIDLEKQEDVHVLQACDSGLHKIRALLDEWSRLRPLSAG
jgi:hypothetical protein